MSAKRSGGRRLGALGAGAAGALAAGRRRLDGQSGAEERLRRITATAPDAVISLDPLGLVTDWNTAAERLFGWSHEEAMGSELADLVVPDELREAHRSGLARVAASGESKLVGKPLELVGRHRDGHEVPIDLTIVAVPSNGTVGFTAFVRSTHERWRLLEERRRRIGEQTARARAEQLAERAQHLQRLSEVALAHVSVEGLLGEMLARMCTLLDVEVASILLVEEESGDLVIRASTGPTDELVRMPNGAGFAGRVAAEGRAVLQHDPDLGELLDPAMRRPDVVSLIGIPLMSRDVPVGVMQAAAVRPRRFDEEDLALLALAGERVAVALERAALFEREHRIAATLQRTLLPTRLPARPGLALAARYVPAAAEAEVGGDWYDAVELPGGRIALALGDVEGKGLRAASLVGGLRSAFRAYAFDGHGPAEVARRLSELLLHDDEHPQIATVWTGLLDPASGELRCASAGHPQPLLVQADGEPRYLTGEGSVPLGVLPATTYDEQRLKLAPGDVLLVYSDGLVEHRGQPLATGLERLLELAGGCPAGAEELCDRVLDAMVGKHPLSDDVALVALGPALLAGRLRVEVPSDASALSGARQLVERLLREEGIPREETYGIVLAVGEACNNAIEHAYGPRAGRFDLEASVVDGAVSVAVSDRGAWREQRGVDAGRGLDLMRALMDSVEVESGANGTTVRLVKRVPVAAVS